MAFWTPYQCFLVVMLVSFGTWNTITTKWADKIEAKSSDGKIRGFAHPFTQALTMFIGEAFCMVAYKIFFCVYKSRNDGSEDQNTLTAGNRNFSIWIFLVPAMCDMIATSVMYVGLNLTYASSFQMLRGSLIAFVAVLSILLLKRKITKVEWLGIFVVIVGLVIVGLSDFIHGDSSGTSTDDIILGDVLIIVAQIVAAMQMVSEEYFVSKQNIAPLQAVGWEGIFGGIVLAILHIPMYYIIVGRPFAHNPRGALEDLPDALVQIGNEPLLLVPLLGTVVSIAFFNFAGIAITKEISAATRTVLDSVRTLFIWLITLGLGWQEFSYLQIIGFVFLVLGMLIYNDIYVNNMAANLYYRCRGVNKADINADHKKKEVDELSPPEEYVSTQL